MVEIRRGGGCPGFRGETKPRLRGCLLCHDLHDTRFLFPAAEETLRTQLAKSVIYRRHRLLYNRRHAQKLAQGRMDKTTAEPSDGTPAALKPALIQRLAPHAKRAGGKAPATDHGYSETLPSKRVIWGTSTAKPISSPSMPTKDVTADIYEPTGDAVSSFLPTARYPSLQRPSKRSRPY